MLETSRSGYYDWLKNSAARKERKKQREKLVEAIRRIHEESGGTYGSPRILRVLRSEGIKCGKHRLEKLMREEGIFGKQKRKWVATTDSNHGNPVLPNRLNRKFTAHEPNRKWVSDITYCAKEEGWLYVAAIMDLYSRTIVGWAASDRINTDLVSTALDRAIDKRKPGRGLILHSDRGSQYTSREYQKKTLGERNHRIDEQERELLGQRAHGKLLRDHEDGVRLWEKEIRNEGGGEDGPLQVHRDILQQKAAAFGKSPETYEKQRLRA